MRGLRALTVLAAAEALAPSATAATQAAYARVSSVSAGATTLAAGAATPTVGASSVAQTVGYRAEGLADHWGVDLSLGASQSDYSSLVVQDSRGRLRPLSDLTGRPRELSAQVSLSYVRGSDRAEIGAGLPLVRFPYESRRVSLAYERGFENASTRLGARYTQLSIDEPPTYFIGSDFVAHARPTLVHAFESRLYVDQLLSETWKARAELSVSERIEDRPRNVGVELAQGWALRDTLFLRNRVAYRRELSSQSLANERGYFTTALASWELASEFSYGSTLALAYTLMVESERDPRVDSYLRVGSDQYGLSFRREWRRLSLELGALWQRSSLPSKQLALQGALEWKL